MDATLMVITLVSLATTGAVLVFLTRLVREERERSEARVAALADQIHADPAAAPAESLALRRQNALREIRNLARSIDRPPAVEAGTSEAASPSRLRTLPPPVDPPRRGDPGPASAASRADDEIGPPPAGQLFAQAPAHGSTRRTWLAAAAGAAMVTLLLALVFVVNGPSDRPQAATPAAGQALELLSLAHTRSGEAVTVSGLVRNPAGASIREEVAAVVFLFDRTGAFLSSARAPLDYRALGPGDESPFVVVVPRGEGVARYRVSFRAGDSLVPHVDRRVQ